MRLDADFEASLHAALAAPGVRRPPSDWPPFRLPVAVRETLVAAAQLPDGCPDAVVAHYTRKLPALLVQQLFVADDPGARLLWRPLGPARLPRFAAALGGLGEHAPFVLAGLEDSLAAHVAAAPLFARTLFGSGMPLLGAFPIERQTMAADLAAGRDPDEVIDLRLSGNLIHELCQGRPRDDRAALRPPPPWPLLEAAALHLGLAARPAHMFPDTAAEAVPGVAMFVLIGAGLERLFGARALWQLLDGDPLETSFGAAAVPLAVAGWQAWLRRRQPPFVADALDAEAWIKLADRARAGEIALPAGDPLTLAPLVPDFLGEAARTPWADLPWSAQEPALADEAMVPIGVRSLFLVNVLAPNLQTHPDELPGERLILDVDACRRGAAPRSHGVCGGPAWWIFPPPQARNLRARGARIVVVERARRAEISRIAERLLELCAGGEDLASEVVLFL